MKIGSLIFATQQGLGTLARDFHRHGVVTDVFLIRHGSRTDHTEWYPGADIANSLYDPSTLNRIHEFLQKMDAMLFFETPFDWSFIQYCKDRRIETVLMPMYECMPRVWPVQPDVVINPSALDQQYYPQGIQINVPVPDEIRQNWRLRKKAETFVHNAGNWGLKGRNGTKELIEAIKLVKSPARIILRSQIPCDRHLLPNMGNEKRKVELHVGNFENHLYYEGDVFVFPDRFNGLSLPLQEAYASGMAIMATDRFPANTWLKREMLIPIQGYKTDSISGRMVEFQSAVVTPQSIANKIDEWYGKDISEFSEAGFEWAKQNSWEVLKPKYLEVLK